MKTTQVKKLAYKANNGVHLKAFTKLRDKLTKRHEVLTEELKEIREALGLNGYSGINGSNGAVTPTGRPRNNKSLKDVVLEVLANGKEMSKHQVLDEVIKRSYSFSTKDPLNTLGTVLYGKNPRFQNNKGMFSLKK
jgi:hypothetical protein